MGDGSAPKEWYFNTVTGRAELGPKSPVGHRMGPYATREDALDAWRIVHERNLVWDEQDRAWRRWGDSGADGTVGDRGSDGSAGTGPDGGSTGM